MPRMSKEEIDKKQALSKAYANSAPARGASSGSFTRNSGRYGGTKETIHQRSGHLSASASAPAPTATKPAPKPAVPKEQSLKIEPVKASPEVTQAKAKVQAYEKKDYSNIFKQDETDFTSKYNPSGQSDNSGGPQKDPQAFADKYKFKAAEANKQIDTTSDNPMTSSDILKKDKEQYGSYM